MSFATTADDASPAFGRRLVELAPGIALLLAIGYSGKLIEQTIAAYGKANHLALPNIEYVLWAIVIGLIIANTVGVPSQQRDPITRSLRLDLGRERRSAR